MLSHWNVGRGATSGQTAKDVFFMTLASLKHCGDWAIVAGDFHIQPPTFKKMVLGFLDILLPLIYGMYVEDYAKTESMEKLTLSGNAFAHYPCAHYTTDVTFQQANMPSGKQAERKRYYSKKHKLHGCKTSLFSERISNSIAQHLKKLPSEERLADDGLLHDDYPNDWAVLCDKAYQGLVTVLRAIHPTKKQRGRSLTLAQVNENHDISRDRIVVENCFGRLCTLWALCSDKFRWNEDKYDTIFRACVALTNAHARWSPLRASDGAAFRAHRKRLMGIGAAREERRKEIQRRSRRNRAIRTSNSVMTLPANSGVDDYQDFSTEY
ncbi:hypothetical protein PR003_g931 [Phytophthora rubi]|uniref:DDE Tnp4 domain-containing protein n=1 Tax=Phytophthora rubi TaxID=129364 RepID=A0A6A4G7R6_9STRA|nr:hypothetical protein PR001_g17818 [Phytophthora rubi]KAE9038980.1 hypothetical protein PR002_g5731 [Phytophthora rubi]KAE9359077.1 hypothetical protein PR003_g931 [Phytophthora rubi]